MKKTMMFNDKNFLKSMLKLAIPIMLQNLILSSLNLVDTIIIGALRETAIAGVGLANQYFFLLNLLLFGISSGSSIFTAQYWGRRDIKNIRKVLGICIITGGIASLLFSIGGLLFPEKILGIFSHDKSVIQVGTEYLRIIVFSYVITSITYAYSFVLRSTGEVRLTLYVSTMALIINTVLNYILVFGLFGMPKLGVAGSAIATVIARFIEFGLLIYFVYKKKHAAAGSLSEMFHLSSEFISNFFKVTLPVILNESVWALGVSLYSVAYARMGTEVVASTNISGTVEKIIWVVFMGICNACAIMIGNKLGRGEKEEPYIYARRFLTLGPITAIIMGGVVVLASPWILSAFNVSSIVYNYAIKNLIVFSIFLIAKVTNYIIIIGILRSGGDTRFCMMLDIGGVWLIGVPFAFIGGLVWKLPVYIVYALISLEEVAKLALGIRRVVSKKWIKNLA